MEMKRGQVVRSKAGHDKGDFQTILELSPRCALVCDGRRRPLSRPKRKKLIHLAPVNEVLPEEALSTDRKIRNAPRPFRERADATGERGR